MSHSDQDRLENLNLALRLLMQDLGEPYEWQLHDAQSPKFAGVHRTTWEELVRRHLVKSRSFNQYHLTGRGWIAGLKVTGRFNDPNFQSKAGLLSRSLKSKVDGRRGCGSADRTELAAETGLSEFFVYDAIDSHLLRAMFGRIDASWAADDPMKNYIEIPADFGHRILSGA